MQPVRTIEAGMEGTKLQKTIGDSSAALTRAIVHPALQSGTQEKWPAVWAHSAAGTIKSSFAPHTLRRQPHMKRQDSNGAVSRTPTFAGYSKVCTSGFTEASKLPRYHCASSCGNDRTNRSLGPPPGSRAESSLGAAMAAKLLMQRSKR
jgi:hypothetical protein